MDGRVEIKITSREEDEYEQAVENSTNMRILEAISSISIYPFDYEVGSYIEVRSEDLTLVARIMRISLKQRENPEFDNIDIHVQWLYRKWQLPTKSLGIDSDELKYIAKNEVFPSNHFQSIPVNSIVSPC
jgi:hypothetical protein